MESHRPPPPNRPRLPYRIETSDDTGTLTLTFFSARKDYLEKILPVGTRRYVSGTAALYDGMLQMVHPDRVVDEAGLAKLPLVEPVYPLTEGSVRKPVAPRDRRRAGESSRAAGMAGSGVAGAQKVSRVCRCAAPIAPAARARRRESRKRRRGRGSRSTNFWPASSRSAWCAPTPAGRRGGVRPATVRLRKKIIAALPYTLTGSQTKALADITADLAKPERMTRLLQGDVGSGKTVVALLACAAVIEAGGQAALMAPTEILARQHHKTIAPLAAAAGIRVAILTGRERGRERTKILDGLTAGDIDLLIGTHALFQDEVAFKNLALAVVDEQHRFGVHQRLALARKGEAVDMLVMTATPIPRTWCSPILATWISPTCAKSPPDGCRSTRAPSRSTGSTK